MKYAVLSPEHRLICFDHSNQVAEYCLRVDNDSLNDYCESQEWVYETMTPTEIGQLYTEIGAVDGGCQIYETRDILETMKEQGAEQEYIDQANDLFNSRELHDEINCPGFIEDVLGEMTPITAAQMTDGIYFMDNIDSPREEKDNG
ncbi:MAG: hypothetical protein E7231_13715 [Cellulosilyticum sp.]|nr:hypothetical protein [Cellulosilyticum sp.]